MDNWIIYGVLASIFWGSYIVLTKITATKGINQNTITILMLIGIAIVFIINAEINGIQIPQNKTGILLGITAGGLWALGMIMSILAITKGADVSRLAPIYNTNTLVTVILGILILQEELTIKTIAGAILIILGGIIIS